MKEEPNPTEFEVVAANAMSRRQALTAFGAAAFITALPASQASRADADSFGFKAVPANTSDTVTVPEGFAWKPIIRWGDPLWSDAPDFDPASRSDAASQARQFGDNNDGMQIYHAEGHTLLAVNHEYVNRRFAFPHAPSHEPATADDIAKSKAAHGLSVIEIAEGSDGWALVKDSPFNRRITPETPMRITGPAAGDPLVRTGADPAGAFPIGTFANCGASRTPWGTYLTCEENFDGYFTNSDGFAEPADDLKRYGVGSRNWRLNWSQTDPRFDLAEEPYEPRRFGYVVEVDPLEPTSTPHKLSALGRFKHENAEVALALSGHAVVYMGDDERGEFLYRFVSARRFDPIGDNSSILEEGRLYAAKFEDDGRGRWLELTPETTGLASQAEVSVLTRQAGSAVGATTMDRPEWVAVHPTRAEAYCALSKNKRRGVGANRGGDPMTVGGPNPRAKNRYGQILRWRPNGGDHAADGFAWDLFVMAGNPAVHSGAKAGSQNVRPDNMFSGPDGLTVAPDGKLWIRTDGSDSNEGDFAGMGNNQMLVGNTASGEIRRFLVGPAGAELTGFAWSEDRRTIFVGVQHPGRSRESSFPDGGNGPPRSTIVAVWREDGRAIV